MEVTTLLRVPAVSSLLDLSVNAPQVEISTCWIHLDAINFSTSEDLVVRLLTEFHAPVVNWVLEQRRGKRNLNRSYTTRLNGSN